MSFLYAATCLTAISLGSLSPILGTLGDTFALSSVGIGVITASFGLARLICDIPAGRMIERFGHRRTFVFGCFIIAIGQGLGVAARETPQIVIGQFLVGIGYAMTTLTVISVAVAHTGVAGRVWRGNLVELMIIFGAVVGTNFGGLLATTIGWRGAFALASVAAALAGSLITIAPWPLQYVRAYGLTHDSHHAILGIRVSPPAFPWGTAVLLATNFCLGITWSGYLMTHVPLFAATVLRIRPDQIGRILGLGLAVDGVLLVVVGRLANRLSQPGMLSVGLLILASSIAMLPFTHGYAGMVLVGILLGSGHCIWMIPSGLLVEIHRSGRVDRLLALQRLVLDLSFTASPLFLGWGISRFGYGPTSGLTIVVLLVVVFSVMVIRIPQLDVRR